MFYRFIVIVALIWSSLAVARPPASDVQGIYTHTREDRKIYSPLWGMVALEGDLLKGTRFYSDYGILSRDPDTRSKQSRYTHPSVAIQLKRHNTLAQKLFPNIGLDPKQLYSDSELLDLIQKNQPSGSKDQADLIATLKKPLDDFPKDAIAGWLQALFPSPHFLELSPNMRKHDQIGSLLTESNLATLNALIEFMIQYREGQLPQDSFVEMVTYLFNALGEFYKTKISTQKISGGQVAAFQQESSRLAIMIADALDEEKTLANPQNPNQQIYPLREEP